MHFSFYTFQNLREEMAMDVDDDEDGTQRPKAVADYDIQIDFSSIDDEDSEDPATILARLDKGITEKTAEIERMAPNMKAMERYELDLFSVTVEFISLGASLDGVEMKLADAEREAEQARKESKRARDNFNDVKKRRYDFVRTLYSIIAHDGL
jgi:structural maintenance of chromosome 1